MDYKINFRSGGKELTGYVETDDLIDKAGGVDTEVIIEIDLTDSETGDKIGITPSIREQILTELQRNFTIEFAKPVDPKQERNKEKPAVWTLR